MRCCEEDLATVEDIRYEGVNLQHMNMDNVQHDMEDMMSQQLS